jgi:hypothetical protein
MCYNYTKYVVKPQNLCGKTFLFFGPGKNFEKFRENLNSYLTYNNLTFLFLGGSPFFLKSIFGGSPRISFAFSLTD